MSYTGQKFSDQWLQVKHSETGGVGLIPNDEATRVLYEAKGWEVVDLDPTLDPDAPNTGETADLPTAEPPEPEQDPGQLDEIETAPNSPSEQTPGQPEAEPTPASTTE